MSNKFSSFKSHQLITENWRKFLAESPDPVDAAEAALSQLPAAAQEKLLNVLLSKLDTVTLQEGEDQTNLIAKTLVKLPGGRDLAAMYMAFLDRETPDGLRRLAAFAILNFISPVDMGTIMGLDIIAMIPGLQPMMALDDIYLLRRMLKKYKKAGLPSEEHHDQVQRLAGEELRVDKDNREVADAEIEDAHARSRAAREAAEKKPKQL